MTDNTFQTAAHSYATPVSYGSRKRCRVAGSLVALAALTLIPASNAATWNNTGSGSWATASDWDTGVVPNAVGASASFITNNSANRTITNDSGAPGFTVGSLSFDIGSSFNTSLTTGSAGSNLKLDNGGSGVTISATGSGTGNNSISVPLVFNDSVTAIVDQPITTGAGALNLTATISGSGGFTKRGDGLSTFGTGTKTYTGATVLSGGRMRISITAAPTATSSFTINSGAQLEIIAAGTVTFGSGPLNLNGSGAVTGPFAAFPGAIRNTSGLAVTIGNPVNLQSPTVLHVQATAGTGNNQPPTGSLTFSGVMGGIGGLTLTAPNSNVDQGTLILNANNTYSGGTFVAGGILTATGPSAHFGLGNVTVNNASAPLAVAKLSITTGVLDAISNNATLSLAGGGAQGIADQSYAFLDTGINELVGSLVLGGVTRPAGTYGSVGSGATFQDNEYFSGPGIVTVVPEPGTSTILLGGLSMLAGLRPWRRRR